MKWYRLILCLLIISKACLSYAQFTETNLKDVEGLSVGLEKNTSLWLDYGFKSGVHVKMKHTAIADNFSRQMWRAEVAYDFSNKYFAIHANPFVASDWKTSFVNIGSYLSINNIWKNDFFQIGAEYVPFYDSELKFQNGWAAAAQVSLFKDVSLFAEYGKKPDYRIAYQRLYMGLTFKVLNLMVKPMLEVPFYDSGLQIDHSKVVVSFSYSFQKRKT